MFNRIKRFVPTGILTVGTLIFCILFSVRAELLSASDYGSLVLAEQIRETMVAVIVECAVGSILFKLSLRKGKSEDRDSGQKL